MIKDIIIHRGPREVAPLRARAKLHEVSSGPIRSILLATGVLLVRATQSNFASSQDSLPLEATSLAESDAVT